MADEFMSDEDKALFRDHMRSVKPLDEKKKRITTPKSIIISQSKKIKNCAEPYQAPAKKIQKEYYLSDFITDTVLSETTLSYHTHSIPSKRVRDLKNGSIPWEAKLDLHGLKADAARQALCQFIHIQLQNNKRCLLVVHGKGGHEGAPPVIKNLVNRWLPQFEEVLAFHSAKAKDGGHGAVYVLLKKNRKEQPF